MSTSLLVIANTNAGASDDAQLDLPLTLMRGRASVEEARTRNPGELDQVLSQAGNRRIVVAGGDGSLHAVLSVLHERHELGRNQIALLPLGTGNDLARSNGLPLDIEDAAEVALEGAARSMDLIVDEIGTIVVNNAHIGAGAPASGA